MCLHFLFPPLARKVDLRVVLGIDPASAEKLRRPVRGCDVSQIRAVGIHRVHIEETVTAHAGHRKEKPVARM